MSARTNGNAGTPDLRSKFVKGATAGENPGATGGDTVFSHAGAAVADHADHTHPYSDVLEHTHPVTDPGHVHDNDTENRGQREPLEFKDAAQLTTRLLLQAFQATQQASVLISSWSRS